MILKVTLDGPEQYWLMDGIKNVVVCGVFKEQLPLNSHIINLLTGIKSDTDTLAARFLRCYKEIGELILVCVNTDCYLMSDEGHTIEKIIVEPPDRI